MTADWSFYEQCATDPIRNPISGEFFSTESVGNAAEEIVREGIQNSLDARLDRINGQAEVRIFLSEITAALPALQIKKWFGGLWQHIEVPSNGLRNPPDPSKPCRFLCFEDFGTTGLTGAPNTHHVITGEKNHFLNFFRAEGHSDKSEHDRGSWGIGKTVFPRASRISTFFGLSIRSDDNQRLLLGRSILKYHQLNGQYFKSDGYFGIRRQDGFVEPCTDQKLLDDFCRDFNLTRENRSGLSLVVPWCDEQDEDITRDNVVRAVLEGFFHPILSGHLSVTITTPDRDLKLDKQSIISQVEALGGDFADGLLPSLRLAEWAKTCGESEFQELIPPTAGKAQRWSPELIPGLILEQIRCSLENRQRVAVRVPMEVQSRKTTPQPTFFDVFLEHSDNQTEKTVFIRDELIIPAVKSPRIAQVRAMVIVEDEPLAALLRDAENPAHVEWSPKTGNFKDKYKFGPGVIEFVQHSVSEILQIVNQADRKPDPSITIDYFSLPALPDDAETILSKRREPKPNARNQTLEPPPTINRRPKRFHIHSLRGGFRITAGDPGTKSPQSLTIRVAYDVRHGNPLKKYHPADFDLAKLPIRVISENDSIKIESADLNQLRVNICKPDFQLEVNGFDVFRDVYVKADAEMYGKEVDDDC